MTSKDRNELTFNSGHLQFINFNQTLALGAVRRPDILQQSQLPVRPIQANLMTWMGRSSCGQLCLCGSAHHFKRKSLSGQLEWPNSLQGLPYSTGEPIDLREKK